MLFCDKCCSVLKEELDMCWPSTFEIQSLQRSWLEGTLPFPHRLYTSVSCSCVYHRRLSDVRVDTVVCQWQSDRTGPKKKDEGESVTGLLVGRGLTLNLCFCARNNLKASYVLLKWPAFLDVCPPHPLHSCIFLCAVCTLWKGNQTIYFTSHGVKPSGAAFNRWLTWLMICIVIRLWISRVRKWDGGQIWHNINSWN